MELNTLDNFYLDQPEPLRSTLLALKEIIMDQDINLTNSLKYGMPFFSYKGKMFCYLWKDKKTNEPYIGIVEGNRLERLLLEPGSRKRVIPIII